MASLTTAHKNWIDRSPRYRHSREDDNLARVIRGETEFECRYQDLSETGARCVARRAAGLNIGDLVEIRLPAPGAIGPIIAQACVTRTDGERDFAVRFEALEPGGFARLRRGVEDAIARRRFAGARRAVTAARDFIWLRWPMLLAVAVTCTVAWSALSWLTAPRGNYSPDKTVPWGDRTF